MSDTMAGLRRKINGAGDLQSVVRTMKAMAASSIGQYEQSVRALGDYYRTVELGLGICFRKNARASAMPARHGRSDATTVGAVVFGSDQGLVGRFNDTVAEFAASRMAAVPGRHAIWTVGERVHGRLSEDGLSPAGQFALPNSVAAIAPMVWRILVEVEAHNDGAGVSGLYLFYNRTSAGSAYEPVAQRLLPLDASWQRGLAERPWPGNNLPAVIGDDTATLSALIREYFFVSLFRACAESLASENASRLAAMQRADRNIDELLETLSGRFHTLRQSSIDEELFDVISGFESLDKA